MPQLDRGNWAMAIAHSNPIVAQDSTCDELAVVWKLRQIVRRALGGKHPAGMRQLKAPGSYELLQIMHGHPIRYGPLVTQHTRGFGRRFGIAEVRFQLVRTKENRLGIFRCIDRPTLSEPVVQVQKGRIYPFC